MRNPATRLARTRAIVALVLAVLPRFPAAQEPSAIGKDAWVRVTTPHFTLFGEVPEKRLRFVAARLEAFLAALQRLHPGRGPSPRDTRVYVFKDARSGRPYTPASGDPDSLLGVNQQYDVPNYVTVAAPTDDPPLDILYHAYAHQFLEDAFPRLPRTVDEGLAEVYTGFKLAPEGTLIGLANAADVRWLKDNPALSLERQFSVGAQSPPPAVGGDRTKFVAGSWALMHYLVCGSAERQARLPAFLDALERGVPADDATVSAFGRSLEDLQRDVALYLRSDRFPPVSIDEGGSARPSIEGSGFRAAPMGRDEVLAALGDVLGHAGADRSTDAEALLREALRLNPDQARAHAAIGYLRYAQGQPVAAVPSLERAIEIDADAMSCYLLARTILKLNTAVGTAPATPAQDATRTPVWLARVRDLLSRAIELQPGFAAPYVTLGATHTLPDGDVAAGIAVLDKARGMLPGRMDIDGNLVYLLLRKGDLARARSLVGDTLAHGGDAEALRKAQAAIATFQANAAARQSAQKPPVSQGNAVPTDPRVEAFQGQELQRLRQELDATTDPVERARLEKAMKALAPSPVDIKAVSVFNEAVDRANKRDYAGAIALLEALQPKVEDGEFKDQITALLERLRQDAARLRAVQ